MGQRVDKNLGSGKEETKGGEARFLVKGKREPFTLGSERVEKKKT